MTCPYLEYRDGDAFEAPRAFCGAVSEFVQPMRADICNDRYELRHADHCEIYREHGADSEAGADAEATSGDGRDRGGADTDG